MQNVDTRKFILAIKKNGYTLERNSGGHAIFHDLNGNQLSVPVHGKTVNGALVKGIMAKYKINM